MKQSTSFAQVATNLLNVLQGYTKGIRFVAVLTMLLIVGIGQAWGTEATISTFTNTSGKFGDVSYNAYKGGGTSNPAVNDGAIRLYQNSKGNTGGYIVLSVPDGYTITSATIKSTMATTTGYYIASNPGATTPVKANFEVSNKSLSANTAYTVSGLSTQYITFACFGTSSSSRLYLSYLSVTYESPAQSYNVVLYRNNEVETINNVTSGTSLDDIAGTGEQGGCAEWSFVGWSKSQRSDQDDSTPMDLVTEVDGAGPYYAVYSHTADGGGGSTTKTMNSFTSTSGNIGGDANVSYAAAQGTAGTAPGVYSNEIRIYQNGGTLTITGNNGKKLTSITIGSSMKTSVSYKIDGGSESSAQSITANGKYTLSDIDATSVLFTCEGTDKNSRLYLNYLSVTYSGGQTVYYTTTPDCKPQTPTYTITWKNADGTILETDNNVESGATPQYNGATPTKAATAQYTYTFAGWDPEISTVTGDQIYTAKFTETLNKYTITWKNADGTTLKTESLKYGATPSYDGTPTKEQDAQYTYTFKGWTPTIATVTGNQTYTATYTSTIRQYAVTFDNNGHGDKPTDQNVDYNGNATNPGDLSATGYIFNGWYDNSGNPFDFENTKITGPITITAKWCEILGDAIGLSVQTDYEVNGQTYVKFSWTPADNTKSHASKQVICIGKVGEEKKCTDLEENQVWTADLRSKLSPGEYEWTIQAIGDGTDYCDGRVIAGTNFTIVGYVVSFNTDGGDGDYNDVTVFEGETFALPTAPTKTGYTFKGWSDGTNLYQPGVEISNLTGDLTLTAIWLTTTSLSWSAPTCTATIASPSNVFPELTTTPADLQGVQYSSSEPTVATIDANGNIRLLTAGETTITANFVENATHAASSAEYTLAVVASNNCKWIETDINDIESGDEVVITMTGINGTTYTLYNTPDTKKAPLVVVVNKISGTYITSDVADGIKWVVNKDGDELTFKSYLSDNYLYCTDNNNGVRVGNTSSSQIFTMDNESGYLKHTVTNRYLGVYNNQDWRCYTDKDNFAGQTFKFYKKTCLPSNEYWVTYNLKNVSCTTSPKVETITSTSEGFEVTFVANDGYVLTDDIEVQMENGELEISWSKDKGKLTVKKTDDGFTGNITISLAACLSLPAPQNLDAQNITSSSVTLTWDAVAGAQSYEVFVTDFDKQDITRSDLTECQVTISGLTKNTKFTWDVKAVAEGYCGMPSELGTFTTLQTYDVTFNNNGHTNAELMPATQTVDDGSLAQEPADDPSDNGYSFGGWYDNKNCEGEPFSFLETPITANTVLYAKWDVVIYDITYADLEGATNHANNPATYTIETPTITFLAPSTRDGYIFSGWSPAALEKGNYGNKTITATWEKGKIVTWKADGNVIEQQTYASGDKLVLPTEEIEACQGSVFVGWTDDENYSHATDAPTYVTAGSAVTTDAIYYAVYAEEPEGELVEEVEKTYTFSQYTAGTQYAENEVHKLDDDVTITTTKCHFTSELRVYDSSTNDGIVISNALPGRICSMSFNLGYKAATLHVYGSINGENWTLVNSISSESSYSDKVLDFGSTTNYTYFKLDADGDQVRIKTMTITYMSGSGEPSAAHKNYSTTCIPTYYVNYDFADGENGCENESVTAGGDYNICADEPTKTGYTFQHWVDENENTYEAGATIENVQSNITLTAVWEANIYEITWWSNGVEYTTTSHTFDTELQLPADPYTCYGAKTFIGWTEADEVSEDGEGITYIEESTNPSENKTYYAVFADEELGEPEKHDATLSFASKDQRTEFSSTQQVWEQNGITLTNDKASAQSDVADYANPARFYAASSISITAPGNITKIVFTCSADKYATALATSIGATSSGTNVTATLDGESNTFSIASLSAQVQMSSLTVTYLSTPETTYSNYTTTPTGCAEMDVAENAYVTSANAQSVKVNVPVTVNFQDGYTIEATLNDGTKFEVVSVSEITDNKATVTLAYTPDYSDDTENTSVQLTAKYGENFVIAKSFTLNGRSLPETFAVVAKVGNMWYALPEVGYEAEKHATAYPVEVDDAADPTEVTSAVANNAAWSLRQVYQAQHSNAQHDRYVVSGANVVFENKQNPAKLLNASAQGDKGSNNYLLTSAQYDNYYSTNPGLYEWTLATKDLETYTLTNVQRIDKQINISTNAAFGLHTADVVTSDLRFLPIQGTYTTLATQVVEWKEKSVVVMYNGDPAQTASVSVNAGEAQTTTLSSAQKDIAVYELTADGLATNPTQQLSITIGSEKVILPIPYIISGEKTDLALLPGATVAARQEVAKVADLVVLKDATLTADGAKTNSYKFRNVTVYGGGKLVVPADKGFSVNTLTLRIGGVTEEGNYDYVYPEFELNTTYDGAYSNTSGKINLDYVTTKSQYYTFVAPFKVETKDIKYPVDIYGNNVAADNTGSFEFQYYDGAARAAGERGWKVVAEDPTDGATLTAHQGYTFYGMPKKVNGNRQKFGIHRIPMSIGATKVMEHENSEQTTAVSAYPSQHNINAGWNLIGNPYMATIKDLNNNSIQTGTIVLVDDRWQWSNEADQYNHRFIVFPSNDGEWYYTSQASNATLPAFKNFFVQIAGEKVNALSIPFTHRAPSSISARRAAQDTEEDIELAIVLEKDAAHADQLDFLVNDAYSALYDHNADFTKMMNNTQLNLFGLLMEDNLSFVAVDHLTAKTDLAIGYQVPQAGEYTLRLSEKPYVMWSRVDALYVTDHEVYPEVTTNLLEDDYTFQVGNAETNTTRFTISIIPSKESSGTTTGVDNLLHHDMQPQKFIYNDQLYILRDGVVYDAMGQRIMTINK